MRPTGLASRAAAAGCPGERPGEASVAAAVPAVSAVSAEAPWRWQDHFQVWGQYRTLRLAGRDWPARTRLELLAHGLDPAQAVHGQPGLVAVMMNPGGSRPLAEPDTEGWAPAQPDRTQLQLMRLASAIEPACRHIRVLNLSDLRTPDSQQLFRWIAELGAVGHSLFDAARAGECKRLLGDSATPVLRAWGMGKPLIALARPALQATAAHPVLGLSDDGLSYRHPLPQHAGLQREWLIRVLEQWRALRAPGASEPSGKPCDR